MGRRLRQPKLCENKIRVKQQEEEEQKEAERSTQEKEIYSFDHCRLPCPQKSPWLVFFSHGKRKKSHTLFSIEEEQQFIRNIPELGQKYCLISSYGWLFMADWKTKGCFLINPYTMKKIQVPNLPSTSKINYSRFNCVLSAPPTDSSSVILLLGWYNPVIFYWHQFQHEWKKMQYKLDVEGGIFCPVACNGKVYGLDYGNDYLIVIEFNPRPKVTVIRVLEPLLLHKTAYGMYTVETCGEIFLVCKIETPDVGYVRFEVFNLAFSEMKWIGVQSIGDQAFFLSDAGSCLAISTNESKIHRDCIYYYEKNDLILYKYDMDDRSITMDLPCPNITTPWTAPRWFLPSF